MNGEGFNAKGISRKAARKAELGPRGFTLIELLVVLVIIGIVSAISIPALKGIGQSNTMASATRQLIDDLSFARHKAMTGRTTVHVVFVPNFEIYRGYARPTTPGEADLFDRLKAGCQSSYAIYAERTPGDQPGLHTSRYLTKWRSLPEGIFIPKWQFDQSSTLPRPQSSTLARPFGLTKVRFPTASVQFKEELFHIAFDPNGRVVRTVGTSLVFGQDEFVWLTKGSILPVYDPAGKVTDLDVLEVPRDNWINDNWTNNYNRIRIDAVTGRAKLERPEIE